MSMIICQNLTMLTGKTMNRKDKLFNRFQHQPRDFSWDELVRLLGQLGFEEIRAGRTGGSRRRFMHPSAGIIMVHKPHPDKIVKRYILEQVREKLKKEGLI